MTELLYIGTMVFALGTVCVGAALGYRALSICAVLLGLSTAVFAGKVIAVFGFDVSAATCLFAAIFLCTDVASEVYGRKAAIRIVLTTFACNLAFLAMGFMVTAIEPSQPTPVAAALDGLFSFLPRLMLGGMLAFLASQILDVVLFERLGRATQGKHLWLRNNLSTAASQFIDTTIVWYVAFYAIIPDLWPLILANYAVKLATAVLDTPFCYIGVYLARRRLSRVQFAGDDMQDMIKIRAEQGR